MKRLCVALLAPLVAGASPCLALDTKVAGAIREARANPSAGIDDLKARLEPLDAPTVAALRVALLDGDPFVRQTSVAILGRLGDPCAKLMCRLLKDDEQAVRAAAEEALVRVGKPAVPFLGDLLLAEPPSSDAKVRAARALGKIGDPEGLPFLVETLRRFRGEGFRTALVCEALAGSGPPGVRALLEQLVYPSMREEIYLTLLKADAASVKAQLLAAMKDGSLAPEERALFATKGEKILGTRAIYLDLLPVYGSLPKLSSPAPAALAQERLAVLLSKREAEYLPPLTAEKVRSLSETLRREELAREQAEEKRRAQELENRRRPSMASAPPTAKQPPASGSRTSSGDLFPTELKPPILGQDQPRERHHRPTIAERQKALDEADRRYHEQQLHR